MTTGLSRRIAWTGTIVALLLVAAFGNQWVFKSVHEHEVGPNSGKHILGMLGTPVFVLSKTGAFSNTSGKAMAATIVGALLLIAVVGLVLAGAARALAPARGGVGAFLLGWFSLVAGGAVYVIVVFIIACKDVLGSSQSLSFFLDSVAQGAGYGLFAGWIVGLGTAFAYTSGAGTGSPASAGSYYPPQAYGSQPPPQYPPRQY